MWRGRAARVLLVAAGVGASGIAVPVWARMNQEDKERLQALATYRSRFQYYATQRDGDTPCMSANDFVRSLLSMRRNEEVSEVAADSLSELFAEADANQDGVLSYPEYCMFMTLLTNTRRDIKMCFKMFDADGSNTLDLEEFKMVVKALANDPTVEFSFKGGISDMWFEGGECSLRFTKFYNFVKTLQTAVLRAEFVAAGAVDDTLPYTDAAKLLLNHLSEVPEYIEENLTKFPMGPKPCLLSLESWAGVIEICGSAEQLGSALDIFARSGKPVRRGDLMRAARHCVPKGSSIDDSNIDFLGYVFSDPEQPDAICYQDMVDLMLHKSVFATSTKKRDGPRRNFLQAFAACLMNKGQEYA